MSYDRNAVPKYIQVHNLIKQGYTRRQAAEILGLPLPNVQTLYTNALMNGRIERVKKEPRFKQPQIPRPKVIRL